MDPLLIVVIALSGLSILMMAILLVVMFKKNKSTGESGVGARELGILEGKLSALANEMKNNVDLAMKSGMLEFTNQSNEKFQTFETKVTDSLNKRFDSIVDQNQTTNKLNNEQLDKFKTGITESLNKRFDDLNKQVNDKLTEINKKVDEKLAEGFKGTNDSMTQVRERLQAIDAAQKNIENLSKDVVSLKQVLEGNQSRGQYGEFQLQMVLHNIFGDTEGCYKEQFTMKKVKDGDDVRADAVVFLPEPNKMIAIDSKFPFQDYSKVFDAETEEEKETHIKDFAGAVKKHITAIASKYIVDGKTAPEAIMFIPNDGVFAFIHHNCQDVIEYSREKKVVITSPSTLPPILTTINMVRIQAERAKNAAILSKELQKLSKDFEMFGREWDQFNNALESATKKREAFDNRVGKLSNKFESIKTNESLKEISEQNVIEIGQENN